MSVSIQTFSTHLREEGCKVYFFAPRYPNYKDNDPAIFRFPSFRFPHHPEYPIPIPFSPNIFRIFPKLKIEIVHPQTPFLLGWTAKYLARKTGALLITTYHTFYEEYYHYGYPIPKFITKAFLRKLSKYFCNLCDAVVVPSKPVEELLRSYGVYRPIKVIPTGIEIDEWYCEENPLFPRSAFNIPPKVPIITYVGRLADEKNLTLLFYAFQKVVEEVPDTFLLLVGSGPDESNYRKLAEELGISKQCKFLGFVDRQKVRECLAASRVFVFPSKTETQGLVLAEALAMGVPIVTTDSFGARETITEGEDGYILPAEPEAFSQAIISLITDDELWYRMRENALKNAKRFSARESARKLLDFYRKLLSEKKAGAR
ncbi:glycosyltransferase [bacterium]|nr:glycosyltransferase [bacterium]